MMKFACLARSTWTTQPERASSCSRGATWSFELVNVASDVELELADWTLLMVR